MRKGKKSELSPGVCCSWQWTNCVHFSPTPCAVTSPLLCPDARPHHLTPIHCSSFLPGLPACLSSPRPSLHTIARTILLQLNSNHTLLMLRKPQQLPAAPKLISCIPTSLLKNIHKLAQILPFLRIPAPSDYLLRSEHVPNFFARRPLLPLFILTGMPSCPFFPAFLTTEMQSFL